MKAVVEEWVVKAEGDYATAEREYRVRKLPNHDSVRFHAQQCIEKYIKARLLHSEQAFPKIHDLGQLLNLVLPLESLWETYRAGFNRVSYYAVDFRYPGSSATKEDAQDAIRVCRSFRKTARQSLGLAL